MSYSSSLSNRWKDKDKDSSVDIDIDIDIDDSSLQSSNHDFTSHEPHRIAASASVLAVGAVGGGGGVVDVMDFGVLRFGRSYMLRGKLGRYLTAVPEDSYNSIAIIPPSLSSPAATKATAASAATTVAGSRVYPLGVMGQGVGSSFDCITFVNIENK